MRAMYRAGLAGAGAVTGFALWALSDWLNEAVSASFPAFAALIFVWVFAGGLLALTGPLSLARAAVGAGLLAGGLAVLETIAALRHPTPAGFIDLGYGIGLAFLMGVIALPFVLCWLRGDGIAAPYARLFDETMAGIVRVGLALAAMGAMWLLVFLSNELLEIVGITVLKALYRQDWFAAALTGALTGLALAVVSELLETRSPVILLRLLRLLVPFVLAVVAVFLIALPINGFGRTFGALSAGGTLMAVAAVVLFLVTLAIGTGAEEPPHRVIRASAKALSGLLPVLAGCAGIAIWLRVGQYGWTPERLTAMTLALVLFGFGGMAAFALTKGAGWDDAFRRGNRAGLLLSLGVGVIWLLPILRPEAVSVRSQMARLAVSEPADGETYWDLAHAWGKAGQVALDSLRVAAENGGNTDRVTQIDSAVTAENRWEFLQDMRQQRTNAQLAHADFTLPSWPTGLDSKAALAALNSWHQSEIVDSCAIKLSSGAPACVYLELDLRPDLPGAEPVFFYKDADTLRGVALIAEGQSITLEWTSDSRNAQLPPTESLQALQRGEGLDAVLTRPAVKVGDILFYAR